MSVRFAASIFLLCSCIGLSHQTKSDPTVEQPQIFPVPDISKIFPGTLPAQYTGPFTPWTIENGNDGHDLDAAAKPEKKFAASSGVVPRRMEAEPESEAPESYTLDRSKADLSAGGWRGVENAQHYEHEMYAHKPRPYNVHDLFQNGVDMSWAVAKKLENNPAPAAPSGEVDDGLRFGTTFGEDVEESGQHAFPDVLPPTSKWNPVPPGFRPRFPMGGSLNENLYDPQENVVIRSNPEHANPDALGGPKGGPSAGVWSRKNANPVESDLGPYNLGRK